MAEIDDINKVGGIFGGVEFNSTQGESQAENQTGNIQVKVQQEQEPVDEKVFKTIETTENLPAKPSIWSKIKTTLFTNISFKVELTPYQQKIENELNDFLHQEISFKNLFKRKNKTNEENKNL